MNVLIADVVKSIFDNYGLKILFEGDKFCAIVGDLAPNMHTELKVLKRMNHEQLLEVVYEEISKANNDKQDIGRIHALLINAGFSDEWIDIALKDFGLNKKAEAINSVDVRGIESTNVGVKKIFCKEPSASGVSELKRCLPQYW